MARRHVKALALALAVTLPCAAVADEAVPEPLALMVMLKVLTYDTNFASRGAGDFVVLVPFAKGAEARATAAVAKAEAINLHSINDRALRFVPIALADLPGTKASAVLLHAGFAPETAREVVVASSRARLYTLAFDEPLVKDGGAMLGVASNAGKPQVVINTVTARSVGADFAGAVLKVARTYH